MASLAEAQLVQFLVFDLKPEVTAEEREELLKATRALEQIPGVISVRLGTTLANPPTRRYQLGCIIYYADIKAREGFLPHPIHRDFAEKYLRMTNREDRLNSIVDLRPSSESLPYKER